MISRPGGRFVAHLLGRKMGFPLGDATHLRVTMPSRACSSCVTGTKPDGGVHFPSTSFQSGGIKSHAVLPLAAGIPGVSGDEKLSGPPRSAAFAKDPGDVPALREDGLTAPRRGGCVRSRVLQRLSESRVADGRFDVAFPSAGMIRIRFCGCISAPFLGAPSDSRGRI